MKGWTEEFQETLADMGIPAMAPKKTGYFATLEVQTMLNLLRVIDNPRQDIPLVAVLRSPIYGLQDEELAKIAAERSGLQYLDNIWAYCDRHEDVLSEKLSDLLDTLQEYRRKAETVSVYELLREIYEETGYYALMSAKPGASKEVQISIFCCSRQSNLLKMDIVEYLDFAGTLKCSKNQILILVKQLSERWRMQSS